MNGYTNFHNEPVTHQFGFRVILWNCLTLPCVGLIYWVIHSQGLRTLMPVFALRLYKLPIPGFYYLKDYEGLHRLDLAHVFAMFLLIAVWYLWIATVEVLWFGIDHIPDVTTDRRTYYRFLSGLATVITAGDALLFYFGLADRVDSLWSASTTLVPILATVLYMAILTFIAVVHVRLTTVRVIPRVC